MAQKWYQKASVQAAIISTLGIMIVAMLSFVFQNSNLKKENKRLQQEIEEKNAEIQRLETLLTPFRTIALERYGGTEMQALAKLADRLQDLERTVDQLVKEQTPVLSQLDKEQLEILKKIWLFQRDNGFDKVLIPYDAGMVSFNGIWTNDVEDDYKKILNLGAVEKIVFSIPESFLRIVPYSRIDGLYAVSIVDEARELLEN